MLLILLAAVPAAAQPSDEPEVRGISSSPIRRGERVQFTLEDGDLMDLVRMMETVTGRRFIVNGGTRELTATILSSRSVAPAEAYRAFLAILHHNGLTVIRRGQHFVITEAENIARRPTRVVTDGSAVPTDERFVTWIHHVEHIPLADAQQLLSSLVSPEAHLVGHAATSTLIVIDTGANIRRLRRLLTEVDVARGDAHLWLERLQYADAAATAEQIRAVFDATAETGGAPPPSPAAGRTARTRARAQPTAAASPSSGASSSGTPTSALHALIPEPRSNALIIVATHDAYRRVMVLIRELDQAEGQPPTVRVRRLQYADAENVATTLTAILSGTASASGAAATARASATASVSGLSGTTRVTAHTDLNALLITASPSEYRTIEALVRDLDVAPQQVYLEIVLMELTMNNREALGADILSGFSGLLDPSTIGLIGSAGAGEVAELLTGATLGLSGPPVTDPRLPGGSISSFGVIIQALASSNQADIISRPAILTLDNREATINVGQNIPINGSSVPTIPGLLPGATGAQAQINAAQTAFQGGAGGGRRDTGTIVRVTPHISNAGTIRLEIETEDSRTGETAAGNLNAVSVLQSIAETELIVEDGETAVIAGMMRESHESVRSGVPVLSEIPILGFLFGQTEEVTIRRNLLFFITPHIVRGREDMRAILEQRLHERRELRDRYMAFEGDWTPPVDYRRSRGLVSEILNRLSELDEETARAEAVLGAPRTHELSPPLEMEMEVPGSLEGDVELIRDGRFLAVPDESDLEVVGPGIEPPGERDRVVDRGADGVSPDGA